MKRTERKQADSGAQTHIAFSIAIGLTIAIAALALAQLAEDGDWPPFDTRPNAAPGAISLGETGDFFGGWANSLALVWLIAAAVMQYSSLQLQREELRLSRDEIVKQAKAATAQAEYTADILSLERSRSAAERFERDRRILKDLLLDAIVHEHNEETHLNFARRSIRRIIKEVSSRIKRELNSSQDPSTRDGTIQRFANNTKDIRNLFDEVQASYESIKEDPAYRSILLLKNEACKYERCKDLQDITVKCTKVSDADGA